ncbi:hypothetical protein MA20_20305 [Bradyrhizobium japonicum]|uniref:Uncharacterized protein n=1 Tax=Bradyrhizobium japonicum TaxID=375 RepID=A0A0A3XU66_BRAJP|nr:hypothetical protein [Bradyrhizobium japonicum]KGT77982.1 hypothetical protein MA20_20305 [Bradyrhizobium japonicum]
MFQMSCLYFLIDKLKISDELTVHLHCHRDFYYAIASDFDPSLGFVTRLFLALFGDALVGLIHQFVDFVGRHAFFAHFAELRLRKVEILAFGKVVFELRNGERRLVKQIYVVNSCEYRVGFNKGSRRGTI